jgi:hypothetical protein
MTAVGLGGGVVGYRRGWFGVVVGWLSVAVVMRRGGRGQRMVLPGRVMRESWPGGRMVSPGRARHMVGWPAGSDRRCGLR